MILLFIVIAVSACNPKPPDERDYVTRLTEQHAAKDAEFQKLSDYPIPNSRKADFLPLAYFPIDPVFNVPALLKPSTDSTILYIPTSSGQPRAERRAGTLEFTLQGQPMTLMAFVEADATDLNRLFVPFNDTTSGNETYAGGRYLDLIRNRTGVYELDFNMAYHPYCVYNPLTECPYPPPENRLKVPIRAGERLKDKSAT